MKKTLAILVLTATSQAFASATLNEAFNKALKSSEADHNNQQVVLSVSPDQIQKATFKRSNKVHVLEVESNMMTDITHSTLEAPSKEASKVEGDDFAQLKNEMNGF